MLPITTPQRTALKHQALILWFDEAGISDIPYVGGKNASLGEMIQQLGTQGVQVPTGFSTTAYAYQRFLQQSQIEPQLRELLRDLDVEDISQLRSRVQQARELILNTPFSPSLELAITKAYSRLCQHCGEESSLDVAVRSSVTAEDLSDASFAGQQETYLNVQGICGQTPSDYPKFAHFLVEQGIDSISLNPDSVLKILLVIAHAEAQTSTSKNP